MKKILAIAGSFREHSFNKRILAVAANGAKDSGAEVTTIDLRDFPMSIYDSDLHDLDFDDNASRLQDIIAEHDGFLFASPEYNGSLPGGFKNVIDWTSRTSDKYPMYAIFKGKTAAMMSSSPGQFGAIRCLAHLRTVLITMGIHVLPTEIAVPFVSQKFEGESREITDDKTKVTLENLGAALVEALNRG